MIHLLHGYITTRGRSGVKSLFFLGAVATGASSSGAKTVAAIEEHHGRPIRCPCFR
ncbi:exported protein of unknown function [Hyphomicrobium sp. MC1]|nr:exported protein of unknown function [Hyphomicrobium sp. MC1]